MAMLILLAMKVTTTLRHCGYGALKLRVIAGRGGRCGFRHSYAGH